MTAGRSWRRTARGFYLPADEPPDSPTSRILQTVPLIPESGALGGWAAAYVHGIDLLDGLDPFTMQQLPVMIYSGADLGRLSNDRVHHTRERLAGSDITYVHGRALSQPCPEPVEGPKGIPVTTLARTAIDGARLAPNLAEAVVFLDAMLHSYRVDIAGLKAYPTASARWRGVIQARRALDLAHPDTRSPWESRLRICYLLEARLPKPEVNVPLFSRSGRLVGIPDLFDAEAGFVAEFDGRDHQSDQQHHDDNVREERFESAGLVVSRAGSRALRLDRPALVARLQSGWQRGMHRDRSRDRWTLAQPDWWVEQSEPILSNEEKQALYGI